MQWHNILQMESTYLHILFVEGLALTDEKRTRKTRGNVSRSVHCTVVHPGQTSGVTVHWCIFLRHTPCICINLTWLNTVCLVPFQMNSKCMYKYFLISVMLTFCTLGFYFSGIFSLIRTLEIRAAWYWIKLRWCYFVFYWDLYCTCWDISVFNH